MGDILVFADGAEWGCYFGGGDSDESVYCAVFVRWDDCACLFAVG